MKYNKTFIKEDANPDQKITALIPQNDADWAKLQPYPFVIWLLNNDTKGFNLYEKLALGDRSTETQYINGRKIEYKLTHTAIDMGMKYHLNKDFRNLNPSEALIDGGTITDEQIINMSYDEKVAKIKPEFLTINGDAVYDTDSIDTEALFSLWRIAFMEFCKRELHMEDGLEYIFGNTSSKGGTNLRKGHEIYNLLASYIMNIYAKVGITDFSQPIDNTKSIEIDDWLGSEMKIDGQSVGKTVKEYFDEQLNIIKSNFTKGVGESYGEIKTQFAYGYITDTTQEKHHRPYSIIKKQLQSHVDMKHINNTSNDIIDKFVIDLDKSFFNSNIHSTSGTTALAKDLQNRLLKGSVLLSIYNIKTQFTIIDIIFRKKLNIVNDEIISKVKVGIGTIIDPKIQSTVARKNFLAQGNQIEEYDSLTISSVFNELREELPSIVYNAFTEKNLLTLGIADDNGQTATPTFVANIVAECILAYIFIYISEEERAMKLFKIWNELTHEVIQTKDKFGQPTKSLSKYRVVV